MPPGSLVHIGDIRTKNVKITMIDYSPSHFKEKVVKDISECFPFKSRRSVTWINVDGVADKEVVKKIGDYFGLHPLIKEDIMSTGQRPKIEDFGDHLYVVLKMFSYNSKKKDVEIEQISLIISKSFVVSFQETVGDIFDPVRERIRKSKGRMRKSGPDYLAYVLIDTIVDNYFSVLEKIGEEIEVLEEEVTVNATPATLNGLHRLKREVILLRKSIWPFREVLAFMERDTSRLISRVTHTYLRDVYDHTIEIIDTVETFRDMLSGLLDVYLSSMSNRLNEVMKVLTIISTIFIPLTFISSLYGMNFRFMPELEWRFGYFVVLSIMFCIAVVMVVYFRRRKWV